MHAVHVDAPRKGHNNKLTNRLLSIPHVCSEKQVPVSSETVSLKAQANKLWSFTKIEWCRKPL